MTDNSLSNPNSEIATLTILCPFHFLPLQTFGTQYTHFYCIPTLMQLSSVCQNVFCYKTIPNLTNLT